MFAPFAEIISQFSKITFHMSAGIVSLTLAFFFRIGHKPDLFSMDNNITKSLVPPSVAEALVFFLDLQQIV